MSPTLSRGTGGRASGSIGAAQVAKSPPDGSNWLFVFDTHAVNPFLQNLSFDTERDLEPVLLIGTAPASGRGARQAKRASELSASRSVADFEPDPVALLSIAGKLTKKGR